MQRLANLLTLSALGAVVSVGCSPEVVIAHNDSLAGGGSGGNGGSAAGTGGSDVSGAGTAPVTTGGEGGTDAVVEAPRLLADSVADWSVTQADHGWYYGYDNGSLDSFALMTRKSIITLYVPPSNDAWECWANDTAHWTQIFQLGAHPNGTSTSKPSNSILQRAVRRWVSTFAGDVTISGEIAKIDVVVGATGVGSNGVDASIYVDGKLHYSTFIAGDDGGGRAYKVVASLQVGSTVDFVLDPHEGDDHHDLSRFTGIIVRVDSGPNP